MADGEPCAQRPDAGDRRLDIERPPGVLGHIDTDVPAQQPHGALLGAVLRSIAVLPLRVMRVPSAACG